MESQTGPIIENLGVLFFACTSSTARILTDEHEIKEVVNPDATRSELLVREPMKWKPMSRPCRSQVAKEALTVQCWNCKLETLGSSCSMPTLVHESIREETHGGGW